MLLQDLFYFSAFGLKHPYIQFIKKYGSIVKVFDFTSNSDCSF